MDLYSVESHGKMQQEVFSSSVVGVEIKYESQTDLSPVFSNICGLGPCKMKESLLVIPNHR